MKAIIYAAGRNTRLGPSYAHEPKILLRFGGRSLLEWHLLRLEEVGIEDVVLVTGFRRAQLLTALEALTPRCAFPVREIYNPRFAEGSVLSMESSLPEIDGANSTLLLMDGDVLYPSILLNRLVKSPHPTVLLVDRDYSTANDDPVLVPIRNGRPCDFAKKWTGVSDVLGESVGFFKLSPSDLPELVSSTRARSLGAPGTVNTTPYEEVLRDLVLCGAFHYEDVTGIPWTEIDFPEDVIHAEREVLPQILASATAV